MNRRVLVVEDHPANLRLAREVLVREGYEVIAADRAETAFELARAKPPDLILMDIQLPGMDGITALETLRAEHPGRRVPAVALTAHAMRGDERRFLDRGFDAYLAKPFSYKELVALVARLLAAEPERDE